MLDILGIEGAAAIVMQFLAIWGTANFVMPKLEGSKPGTEWKPEEVAVSAVHHIVYTLTTDAAYEALRHESHENPQHHFLDVFRH